MPFTMRCPGCETRFEFPNDLEGKRIKCKHCGDKFRVERPVRKARDEDDDRPRSRREIDEDRPSSRGRGAMADDRDDDAPRRYRERDEDEPRSKNKGLVLLGIVGGVLALGLIGCVVLIFVLRGGPKGTTNPRVEPGDVVKAPTRSCPLEVTEAQAGALVLPDTGGSFGLVRKKEGNPARKDWLFDAYDLSAGRRVGRIDLVQVEEPKAWTMSPDGKYLLVVETRGLGWAGDHRIHLINVASGKDTDWVPFPKDQKGSPFDAPALFRAEFVTNDHIIALGTNRRIYSYRMSDLSNPEQWPPVASIGDPLGKDWGIRPESYARVQWQSALSADRGRMAIWNGDGYSIVSTTDGQETIRTPSVLVTTRELWPRQSIKREQLRAGPVAFSPDGSVLAGVISHDFRGKEYVLCLWDTREEKAPATYEIPANQYNDATSLQWWGRKYLLLGGSKVFGKEVEGVLIDSRTGLPVRQLMGPEYRRYGLGRDGRLWYVTASDRKDLAVVHVVDGPDGELKVDSADPYEVIPDLKDSFLRRLWMEPTGVLRKPTRYSPPLQQGLIRRP